jgi:hypothetical protein
MLRYLAIATLLVVGTIVVAAHFTRSGKPLEVASVRATGTPSAPRSEAPATSAHAGGVVGNAPWALSALPECFVQVLAAHGTYAFARSKLPTAMQPILPGSRLQSDDCILHVRAHSGVVDRGTEQLVIPPDAHFFRSSSQLALLRKTGSLGELRLYRVSGR